MAKGRFPFLILASAAFALAGCMTPAAQPPVAPVEPPPARAVAIAPKTQSAESLRLKTYYAKLQQDLLSQGLLRTDGGGIDTPFTKRDVVENFVRVALFDEYVTSGGRLVAKQSASALRRWDEPVRFGIRFGDTVPEAQRAIDRATISQYVNRLGRITRHPISMTAPERANFTVLVLNEDERRGIGPTLRALVPGIDEGSVRIVQNIPRSTLCLVLAFSDDQSDYAYSQAVAIVRAEHSDLMRKSCVHEELAQGLGLANDSPRARPSVFNDDEEFAFLTRHDELLLRMLYDPRFKTGMRADVARPLAEVIAAEMMGGAT